MKYLMAALVLAFSINTSLAQSGQPTTRATPGLSADGIGPPTGGSALTPKPDDAPLPGAAGTQPVQGTSGRQAIPGVSENGLAPSTIGK
jgi:hypothetical protein